MTTRTFDTIEQYRVELQMALGQAERRIDWFDVDLSMLGASDRAAADAFRRTLAGSRLARIRVLLHEPEHFHRRCPLLAALLGTYGHAFELRVIDDSHKTEKETWLIADDTTVRRFHADALRGETTEQGRTRALYGQRFESMWAIATPPTEGRRLFI